MEWFVDYANSVVIGGFFRYRQIPEASLVGGGGKMLQDDVLGSLVTFSHASFQLVEKRGLPQINVDMA